MTLVAGKRTFIEHDGTTFELPEQHTAEWGEFNGARTIHLRTPGEGGQYYVTNVDELDDRVTVHVGDWISRSGPASSVGPGDPLPTIRGYPFP